MAVERDRVADPGLFAEFPSQPANRVGGDVADALRHLGCVRLHMLLDGREGSAKMLPSDDLVELEGHPGERGIVGLRLLLDGIPHLGLAIRAAHVMAVFAHQVRTIGLVLEILVVVNAVLVEQQVDHGQRDRRVGPRDQGHPFVGALGRHAHEGIEHDVLQTSRARLRQLADHRVDAIVSAGPQRDAEVQEVIAVVEVRLRHPGRMGQPADEVLAAGAVVPCATDEQIGRPKSHRKGLEHVGLRAPVDAEAAHQFARVVVPDLLELLGDGVEGLVPRDPLPLGIDPFTLDRVRPLQGVVEPVGIVEDVDATQAAGADAALR